MRINFTESSREEIDAHAKMVIDIGGLVQPREKLKVYKFVHTSSQMMYAVKRMLGKSYACYIAIRCCCL